MEPWEKPHQHGHSWRLSGVGRPFWTLLFLFDIASRVMLASRRHRGRGLGGVVVMVAPGAGEVTTAPEPAYGKQKRRLQWTADARVGPISTAAAQCLAPGACWGGFAQQEMEALPVLPEAS